MVTWMEMIVMGALQNGWILDFIKKVFLNNFRSTESLLREERVYIHPLSIPQSLTSYGVSATTRKPTLAYYYKLNCGLTLASPIFLDHLEGKGNRIY